MTYNTWCYENFKGIKKNRVVKFFELTRLDCIKYFVYLGLQIVIPTTKKIIFFIITKNAKKKCIDLK